MTRREMLAFFCVVAAASPAAAINYTLRDRVIAETSALFRAVAPSFIKSHGTRIKSRLILNQWNTSYPIGSNYVNILKKHPIKNEIVSSLYFNSMLQDIIKIENNDRIIFYSDFEINDIYRKIIKDADKPLVPIESVSFYAPVFSGSFNRAAIVVSSAIIWKKTPVWTAEDGIRAASISKILYIFEKKDGKWKEVDSEFLEGT